MRLAALLVTLLFVIGCAERDTGMTVDRTNEKSETTANLPSLNKAPAFRDVARMLSRNCGPCHDLGGKMYDKLPFDSPEIVRSNGTGILRRLDHPEDKTLLEDWLSRHHSTTSSQKTPHYIPRNTLIR